MSFFFFGGIGELLRMVLEFYVICQVVGLFLFFVVEQFCWCEFVVVDLCVLFLDCGVVFVQQVLDVCGEGVYWQCLGVEQVEQCVVVDFVVWFVVQVEGVYVLQVQVVLVVFLVDEGVGFGWVG